MTPLICTLKRIKILIDNNDSKFLLTSGFFKQNQQKNVQNLPVFKFGFILDLDKYTLNIYK